MTNKEKCEIIKQFVDKKDVVGILGSFLIDDAYKDVEFARYMKNSYPEMFYGIHPIIVDELENQKKIMISCVALLESDRISDKLKAEIANQSRQLAEKNVAIGGAARELCETFEKATK